MKKKDTRQRLIDRLRTLATRANGGHVLDFNWIEQEVVPCLQELFRHESIRLRALWSARLLLDHMPADEYKVIEKATKDLAMSATKFILAFRENTAGDPAPASEKPETPPENGILEQGFSWEEGNTGRLLEIVKLLGAATSNGVMKSNVDFLEGLASRLLERPVTPEDYFRPLPTSQSAGFKPSDPLDSQFQASADAGDGAFVQWGDSLPRLYLLRIRNFVYFLGMFQGAWSQPYKGMVMPPVRDDYVSALAKCTDRLRSLFFKLIREPHEDGREGLSLLAKLHMIFGFEARSLLPSLNNPLEHRMFLANQWRGISPDHNFFSCLARGLEEAADMLDGRRPAQPDTKRFPTPLGSGWQDIEIVLEGDTMATIQCGGVSVQYSLQEMGLAGKRQDSVRLKNFLHELAVNPEGINLKKLTASQKETCKGAKRDLSDALIRFFGLKGDPFMNARKMNGYVPSFKISSSDAYEFPEAVASSWEEIAIRKLDERRIEIEAPCKQTFDSGHTDDHGVEAETGHFTADFGRMGLAKGGVPTSEGQLLLEILDKKKGPYHASADHEGLASLARILKRTLPNATGEPFEYDEGRKFWRICFSRE